MSTEFVRDPVAEEARRHSLGRVTRTLGCSCGHEATAPADPDNVHHGTDADVTAMASHMVQSLTDPIAGKIAHRPIGLQFYTYECTCGEAFVECSPLAAFNAFDEHLDAAEHGELS